MMDKEKGLVVVLGRTLDDTPLTVDIRYGGLLIIGDRGMGKSYLLAKCKESLHTVCDLLDSDDTTIGKLEEQMLKKEGTGRNVVLVADDFDKLDDVLRTGLLEIALKGHLIGTYVIASTSDPSAVNGLALCAFRNIVVLRMSRMNGLLRLSPEIITLSTTGEGFLLSTTTNNNGTKFNI